MSTKHRATVLQFDANRPRACKPLTLTGRKRDEAMAYHGEAILSIERAFRTSAASGRAAVMAVINRYFEQGYADGVNDGRTVRAR